MRPCSRSATEIGSPACSGCADAGTSTPGGRPSTPTERTRVRGPSSTWKRTFAVRSSWSITASASRARTERKPLLRYMSVMPSTASR